MGNGRGDDVEGVIKAIEVFEVTVGLVWKGWVVMRKSMVGVILLGERVMVVTVHVMFCVEMVQGKG